MGVDYARARSPRRSLWFLASLAFRYYVVNFGNYEEAYGTLGAIILTLLWFYITGLAMVIGAELNAEIHRASPWGRNPGPKIMGQRKRLGLAASREWFKHHPRLGSGYFSGVARSTRLASFSMRALMRTPRSSTGLQVHVESHAPAFDHEAHRATHLFEAARFADRHRVRPAADAAAQPARDSAPAGTNSI